MKIIKTLTAAAAFAALSACGGGGENTAANSDANLMTDMNAGMTDPNMMGTDMNTGMMGDNMTVSANNVTVVEGADANATGTTNTTDPTNNTM